MARMYGQINVSLVHDGKSWKIDFVGGESHVSLHKNTAYMTHHIVRLLTEHLLALQVGQGAKRVETSGEGK